jgi:hypothetical protein
MMRFGGRAFASVGGSFGRIQVMCEQNRVAAEFYRLILHFPSLISHITRVREPDDVA